MLSEMKRRNLHLPFATLLYFLLAVDVGDTEANLLVGPGSFQLSGSFSCFPLLQRLPRAEAEVLAVLVTLRS